MKYNLRPSGEILNGKTVYKTIYKNIFIVCHSEEKDLFMIYNMNEKVRDRELFSKEFFESRAETNKYIRAFRKKIAFINNEK